MSQSVGIMLTLVNYRIFITRNYFSGERCGPFGTLVQYLCLNKFEYCDTV